MMSFLISFVGALASNTWQHSTPTKAVHWFGRPAGEETTLVDETSGDGAISIIKNFFMIKTKYNIVLFLFAFTFLFSSVETLAQDIKSNYNDSIILHELFNINLRKLKGKQVGAFLSLTNIIPIKISFLQMKPKSIAWGRIRYGSSIWVDIYIDEFRFMKKTLDEGETEDVWTEELFRQEKISKIRIVQNRITLKQFPKKPKMPNL